MADDITLKMNVDTSDAVWAIDKFNESAEKAFKSSNTSTQAWGQSLNKVTTQMTKIVSQMSDLEAGKLPADVATKLQSELKKTNAEITKTEKYLDKLQKHPVKTTEYANWENVLKNVNTQLTKAQTTLSSYNKPTAWTDEFRGTTKQIAALQTKLDSARATLASFTTRGVYTGAEFRNAQAEVVKYRTQLSKLKVQLYTLESTGRKYADNTGFNKATQDVADLTTRANQATTAMTNLENSGKKWDTTEIDKTNIKLNDLYNNANKIKTTLNTPYTGDYTQSNEYQQLASRLTDCYNKGTILDNKINDINGDLRKTSGSSSTFKNSFTNAANSIISKLRSIKGETGKTQTSHNKSFKSMLTTVLKYGFGIRSIFLLYKKVRTVISTGLSEMSKQFSDVADDVYTLKNSWSGFKASLVSAFQPILSYVVPVLTTLINYLTSAMNAIANFFALLTGQSYYYKAVKGNESVADSIGSTGSAAEEANEELAEYDDLIVIDQDSSSGGGGGGGSSSSDAWQWEKTNVEANALADKLSNIWDVFKSAWENKGQAVIDAATTAFNNVKSLISTIADTIYSVFVSGTGQTWVESVLTLFTSILTTIGLIAEAWETAWKKDGNGYKLVESVFNMFTAINTAISTIQDSWNKAWSSGTGVSIVEDVLQSLTNINNTITNIANNFTEAWNTAEVGDRIMETILGIVEEITDFINQITKSTEEWSASLDFYPLLESVSGVLDAIEGVIGSIKEIALDIYNNVVLPLSKKFIESYLPTLLEDTETGLNSISTLLDSLPWDTITTALEKIAELILEIGIEQINDNISSTSVILEELGSVIQSVTSIWSSFKTIVEGVFGIEFDSSSFEIFKTVLTTISVQGNPASLALKLIKEGLSALATVLENVASVIEENEDTLINLGSDIWNGIKEGFQKAVDWAASIKETFDEFVAKVKEFFGINSPAKNVEYLGEYIFEGLMEGIKNKFDSIKDTIQEFKDKLVSKISEKFSDIKERISEVIGDFSLSSLLGLEGDTNKIDIITTISSTFIGGLTSLLDFETFNTTWGNIKSSFKNISNTIKSKFSGIFSKIEDVTNLDDKFKLLYEDWKDKTADLKAKLSGKIKEITDLDTWKTKFTQMWNNWKDGSSTMSAYVGGQLAKITDLDNWKETFKGMYNNWINGSATMSAFVGGQIGSITDLGTKEGGWQKIFTSLRDAWQSKDAEMKVTNKIGDAVNAAISTLGAGVGGWAYYMTQLTSAWHGGDASFTTAFDTEQSTLDSWAQTIGNLAGAWVDKTATFSLTFSAAADDLKSWVNTNVISKINTQFDKVPILKNHHIPLLARGGIVDTATMFVAGEAGKEAVIPLEKNLEWLDNMATRISDKIMNLAIPDVVTGAILPASKEFVQVYNANTEKISMQLNDIIARLSALETAGTSREPIILQVNGHVLAQLIWDENEKRYKQYGY